MTDFRSVDLRIRQRQSLWAIVFLGLRTLRSIGVVQILIFVGFMVARLPSVLVFIALVTILAILLFAGAAVRWWRYTFEVADDELVVRRGVFQQQRLTIPLERVQSVSLEQKLLHRVVSLVQVTLDTAGTETAEFVIDAVDRNVARTLQQAVATHRAASTARIADVGADRLNASPAAEPPPPERVIVRHSPKRLVKVALSQTPFAGLVLIAPLFALADDLGQIVPFDLPTFDERTGAAWLWWFVPLGLATGVTFSVVLNLVRVLLADWNLTLRSTAAGLRRDAGLLATTSVAAPIPRVQILRTRQGLVERRWGLYRLDLATIGTTQIALPGCDGAEAGEIRRLVLADSVGVQDYHGRVASAEMLLRTRLAIVIALASAAALYWILGWWSLLVFLRVPYVAARTRRLVRLRRWGMTDDAVAVHSEFIAWKRNETLLRKVNGVTVSQRLFERKRSLATVTFSTAAGAVSIGMIPLAEAQRLRDLALYSVERDRRVWM